MCLFLSIHIYPDVANFMINTCSLLCPGTIQFLKAYDCKEFSYNAHCDFS